MNAKINNLLEASPPRLPSELEIQAMVSRENPSQDENLRIGERRISDEMNKRIDNLLSKTNSN